MKFDFFVHTEEVNFNERFTQRFRAYDKEVTAALRDSSFPVSVSGGNICDPFVPAERRLITVTSQVEETGYVTMDHASRLSEIIRNVREGDELRIHGSYHGRCPGEFAIQLIALFYLGEFWPYIQCQDPDRRRKLKELVDRKQFAASQLRYGIVFQPDYKPLIPRPGGLHDQLTDESTLIF